MDTIVRTQFWYFHSSCSKKLILNRFYSLVDQVMWTFRSESRCASCRCLSIEPDALSSRILANTSSECATSNTTPLELGLTSRSDVLVCQYLIVWNVQWESPAILLFCYANCTWSNGNFEGSPIDCVHLWGSMDSVNLPLHCSLCAAGHLYWIYDDY